MGINFAKTGSVTIFYAPSAETRARALYATLKQRTRKESSEASADDYAGDEQQWDFSCESLSRDAIGKAFIRAQAIVGLCSSAILIRALPFTHKHRDSPLLCLPPASGEDNVLHLLTLLGWHHGGRRLAHSLAQALRAIGEEVVVVGGSSTDKRLGFALEDVPQGWSIAGEVESTLKFLARGGRYRVNGAACAGFPPKEFYAAAENGKGDSKEDNKEDNLASNGKDEQARRVLVGCNLRTNEAIHLVPRKVAVGIGCVRGVSAQAIASLVEDCLAEAGITRASLCGVASISLKRDECGLLQFAKMWDLPLRFFSSACLKSKSIEHSLRGVADVERAVGTPSVAEAAALCLAIKNTSNTAKSSSDGNSSQLLLTKRKSAVATCALAMSSEPLVESSLAGMSNGCLTLVGLGPGGAMQRTAEASLALRTADALVGYEGYFSLLEYGEVRAEAERCSYPIGAEEERCRAAIALARTGKKTVLLGSGDAGVYALSTLVWQLLAHEKTREENNEDENGKSPPIEVLHAPGISAMHALAARVGAPLADDFCAISLSDVMTASEKILERVDSAARGDFVLALYNPQSATRRSLLPRTLDILREYRLPTTPIACGRLVGRAEESVWISSLADFEHKVVDMHTIVIVGNSQTKTYHSPYGERLYTQRGYRLAEGRSND